jgi:hypothetical protein
MDPDEKKVLNALMAQVDTRELALKMVISVQLVDHVVVYAGDPRISQRQTWWQGLFVNAPLKPFSTAAAKFPDKKVANFVEGIAKEK